MYLIVRNMMVIIGISIYITMNIYNALLISLLAGFSTLIGGLFICVKKIDFKVLLIYLSIAIIMMIGISLFDLIPNALPALYDKYNIKSLLVIISLMIVSYLIIKVLSKFKKEDNSLFHLGIISMIVLVIHNFPEGIITFLTSYIDIKLGIKTSIAIALHNIPEGMMIAVPIYYASGSCKKALLYTFIASFAEPLGAGVAYLFLKNYITSIGISYILIIVAGLMISLALEEIYPYIERHYERKPILIGLLIGLVLIIMSLFI